MNTKLIIFLFSFLFPACLLAQVQHALDFDGTDDKVTTPAGSSLINNSYHISLSCWVLPTNANPVFPDFDGFAGIRNDADADFYLLQVGPNLVEARFRNSFDSAFTITSPVLQLNTWQHFVLTYDSMMIRLYYNGNLTDSMPAYGEITNSGVDFLMGDVYYLGTDFFLNGQLDEVSLWNTTLSSQEIRCIYLGETDSLASGLQLFYTFNQGVLGANNGALTTLHDASNHIDGTLSSFALTGTLSNYVPGISNHTNITDSICFGDIYTFGGQNYAVAGTYYNSIPSSQGCDSVIQLNLSVIAPDTAVVAANGSLHALASGSTFQWIDCSNGNIPVPGEDSSFYFPAGNGSYAVIVTKNGCSDTSGCFIVNGVYVSEQEPGNNLVIFPKPSSNEVNLILPAENESFMLKIYDPEGKKIFEKAYQASPTTILDINSWKPGIYYLHFISNKKTIIEKIIRN